MVSGIYTTWTTCSRHNTSQVIGPNILLIKVVSVGGTFWLLVPCLRKIHTRPASIWTAVSTITEFRSHQQALGNLTSEWTPVGLSPITRMSSYYTFQLKLRIHGLVCVPSVFSQVLASTVLDFKAWRSYGPFDWLTRHSFKDLHLLHHFVKC